ncbi:hypothetical protein FB451DRAFT_1287448 [Mycena latifolia]|nr:hypothetical protein FB451DRAFT_1287448 [Mycena latifolia]
MNIFSPLPTGIPPLPYKWKSGRKSDSDTTAFDTGLDARDQIWGNPVCVVCGTTTDLQYTHIIPQSQDGQRKWQELRARNYVPAEAKDSPVTEPRNGLLFCVQHHFYFDNYRAFIRYFPDTKAYVWLEFTRNLIPVQGNIVMPLPRSEFHGKKLYLDADHPRAPIYSLFLIHESIARGHHPFLATPVEDGVDLTNPSYPNWVATWLSLAAGQGPTSPATSSLTTPTSSSMTGVTETGGGDFGNVASMRAADVAAILNATHSSNTWRSCVREAIHFDGSAQENIEKYAKRVGFEPNAQ